MSNKINKYILPLLALSLISCGGKNNPVGSASELVVTRTDLISRLSVAEDGETIYVGDIDFTGPDSIASAVMRVKLNKSVTIKSGLKKNATFTNGSFDLLGPKVNGELIDVSFENIDFKGLTDHENVTDDSFYYKDAEDNEPWNQQYASNFKGNVKATYSNCSFRDYLGEYGAAMWARYADYSFNESLALYYGNYSDCTLNLNLSSCVFEDNSAYYAGGAIYLEGTSKNIRLSANNCIFNNNTSGCLDYTEGGGAINVNSSKLELSKCSFNNNNGDFSYGKTREDEVFEEFVFPATDSTSGGAINANYSDIDSNECIFNNNQASQGGAISIFGESNTTIDGCVFKNNQATCDVAERETSETGPWSNMGLGGGLYINSGEGGKIDVYNSSFYDNEALNGYGAFYAFYTNGAGAEFVVNPDVTFVLCTFMDNLTTRKYEEITKPWSKEPGDVWSIPYVKTKASVVIDDTFSSLYPRKETPNESNDYCYYGTKEQALKDKVNVAKAENQHLISTSSSHVIDVAPEYMRQLIGERYSNGSKLPSTIGSNYNPVLYQINIEKTPNPAVVIIPVISVVIIAAAIVTSVILFKKKDDKKIKNTDDRQEESRAFNKSDIKTMVNDLPEASTLTKREYEVLTLILEGKKRSEIAESLFLSVSAIKKYTTSLYAKLGVKDRIELLAKITTK